MSGHSKWSTIKRAKGAADAKRGAAFAKIGKRIIIAVKEGGSGDPAHNFKLRLEIEKAKALSLPAENISRAIKKGLGEDGAATLDEVVYECYGPAGTAFIVEAITDNKNRTIQEIKTILTKHGGSLGTSNSVAWQFKKIGEIFVRVDNQSQKEIFSLAAIDAGSEEIEETPEGLEVTTTPEAFTTVKTALTEAGAEIEHAEITQRSDQPIELTEPALLQAQRIYDLLGENDDVMNVYTNIK